jgi:hypothetical protein
MRPRPGRGPFSAIFSPAADERLQYGRSSLIRSGAQMRRDRQVCGHRVPDGLRPWQDPAKAEIFPAMLPGFRFLFAAVVMSMSVLVFGLGAAALMRTAHEDFATNTSWRAPPEPRFAQQDDTTSPVLATLIVRPRAAEPTVSSTENVGAEPESETTAALSVAGASPCEALKPAASMTVASIQSPAQVDAPAKAEPAPTPAAPQTDVPASTGEPKIDAKIELKIAAADTIKPAASASATTGQAPPVTSEINSPSPESSPTDEQTDAPVATVSDAMTRIATLGGPPVIIDDTSANASEAAKEAEAKLEKEKKLQAERARERRLVAARRARLAEQTAASQPLLNPFQPHPLVGSPPTPAR